MRIGRKVSNIAVLGGGGGPPPVDVAAVDFDGANQLRSTDFAAASSSLMSMSIWVKPDLADFGTYWSFSLQDPEGTYVNLSTGTTLIGPSSTNTSFALSVWDAATNTLQFTAYSSIPVVDQTWHNILCSIDTNHPAGSKIINIVVDGVLDTSPHIVDSDPAFNVGWGLGGESWNYNFVAGGGLQYAPGCNADFWYYPGQFIDFTIPANVAKFYNGGMPVDLGTDGSTPLGTPPLIFFHVGTADPPADYATNRGSSGTFAVVGDPLTSCSDNP